mgnify:CR=1 FL=1
MPTFKGFVNKSVTCSTQKGNYLPSKTEIKDLSKVFSRAQNRIMYLRKMIITGRGRRCFQLKLVATKMKRKHDQLLKHSRLYSFRCFLSSEWNPSEMICHGCNMTVEKTSIRLITFDNTRCSICPDCMKDVDRY